MGKQRRKRKKTQPHKNMVIPKKEAVIWGGYNRSGKSTQVEALMKLGEQVFITGAVLKDAATRYPEQEKYKAILRRELVDDDLVMHVARRWVFSKIVNVRHSRLHFDGIPRNRGQLQFLDFLKERKYRIRCIWFTTPMEVCERRVRPERFEDKDDELVKKSRVVYINETLPVLDEIKNHWLSAGDNFLLVDNTDLDKQQSAEQITKFLGLQYSAKVLFPDQPHAGNGHSPSTHIAKEEPALMARPPVAITPNLQPSSYPSNMRMSGR